MAICVPIRNEQARLARLFDALEDLAGPSSDICLLLDHCIDDSRALCMDYRRRSRHRVHVADGPATVSNAGLARDRAMRIGIAALGPGGGILLTTDADSIPRPDWRTAMVSALALADVVAGRVIRQGRRASDEQDRVDRYHDRLFALRRRIDPVAWEAPVTQPWISGANLGMHTTTYVALGGFPALPHGEDAQLVDEAQRAGWRVRRDAASLVWTSDRRRGRVEQGLAAALRRLDRDGLAGMAMAHPADQVWQYRAHAVARDAFAAHRFEKLSAAIALSHDHLLGVARDCPNAEAFAMRVVPVPPAGMRTIPFPAAEAALAGMTVLASSACAA